MTTKCKTTKAAPVAPAAIAEDLAGIAQKKAEEDILTAYVLTSGQCNNLVVQRYLHYVNDGGSVAALSKVSAEQVFAIAGGNLSSLELMLLTQATALQAMFIDLALRAKRQDSFEGTQTLTTLALKCAAQSRQAVTALAELRIPKAVMFAKQANVSNGPQQVNNRVVAPAAPARAEENQHRPNELLDEQRSIPLDRRMTRAAVGADAHLAPVGEVNRSKVSGRQGSVGQERFQGRAPRHTAGADQGRERDAAGPARRVGGSR